MHAEKSKKPKGRHKRTKGEKTKPAVSTSRAWSVWYGVCRRDGRTICKKTKSKIAAKEISTIVAFFLENTLSLQRVFLHKLIKCVEINQTRGLNYGYLSLIAVINRT